MGNLTWSLLFIKTQYINISISQGTSKEGGEDVHVIILPADARLPICTGIPKTVGTHFQHILSHPSLLHSCCQNHVLEIFIMIKELLHSLFISLRNKCSDERLVVLLVREDFIAHGVKYLLSFDLDVSEDHTVLGHDVMSLPF